MRLIRLMESIIVVLFGYWLIFGMVDIEVVKKIIGYTCLAAGGFVLLVNILYLLPDPNIEDEQKKDSKKNNEDSK